jgi:hypothetical protein
LFKKYPTTGSKNIQQLGQKISNNLVKKYPTTSHYLPITYPLSTHYLPITYSLPTHKPIFSSSNSTCLNHYADVLKLRKDRGSIVFFFLRFFNSSKARPKAERSSQLGWQKKGTMTSSTITYHCR